MISCPKCGGKTGFYYDVVLRTHRSGVWGRSDDSEEDNTIIYWPRTVRCLDCGHRVAYDPAHENGVAKVHSEKINHVSL